MATLEKCTVCSQVITERVSNINVIRVGLQPPIPLAKLHGTFNPKIQALKRVLGLTDKHGNG